MENVTTDIDGQPTSKPTSKVTFGALTGLGLTVLVALLTAITPELLAPLGAWANVVYAGIGALAVSLASYLKKPTGEVR